MAEEGRVTVKKQEGGNQFEFVIRGEDHTLGNMLTQQLLKEDRVLFAGYRIQHPLDDLILMRVDVTLSQKETEDDTAVGIMRNPVRKLKEQIEALKKKVSA